MKRRQSIPATLALVTCVRAAAAEPATDTAKSPATKPAPSDGRCPASEAQPAFWLRLSQMYLSEGAKLGSAELTGFGVGLSLGCRTIPWIRFDAWIDLYSGDDKYDTRRNEANFGIDMRLYSNPHYPVQLYGFFGAGFALVDLSER